MRRKRNVTKWDMMRAAAQLGAVATQLLTCVVCMYARPNVKATTGGRPRNLFRQLRYLQYGNMLCKCACGKRGSHGRQESKHGTPTASKLRLRPAATRVMIRRRELPRSSNGSSFAAATLSGSSCAFCHSSHQ